ncbi:uncharacterized protein LOC144114369 [Amblyomma americanum]
MPTACPGQGSSVHAKGLSTASASSRSPASLDQTHQYTPNLTAGGRDSSPAGRECTLCGAPHATLDHILFGCPADPPPQGQPAIGTWEEWEALLASQNPDTQLRCVNRGASAMALRGLDTCA